MREVFIALLLGLPAVALLVAGWFGAELRRFSRTTDEIRSTTDIERMKRVVAHQMYAALAQIVLLAVPPILYFLGLLRGLLVPSDVVLIILPAAVVILAAQVFRRVEAEVRALPAADSGLAAQRDAIVATWVKRPLPDW